MERVSIRVTVNRDGSNPQAFRGPHDPASYFASVCNQYFLYARCSFGVVRGRFEGEESCLDKEMSVVVEFSTEDGCH